MKKFLTRTMLFFTLIGMYFILTGTYNVFVVRNSNQSSSHNLILGDSHAQTSFDLTLLIGWENQSGPAEPYPMTYLKLKYELEKRDLDTIIVSFGHHNLSAFNNDKLIDERANIQFENNPGPFISLRSDWKQMPINQSRLYKVLLKKFLLKPMNLFRSNPNQVLSTRMIRKTDDVAKPIERHYKVDSNITGISELNKTYLEKLIELALSKNIKVILLNTPLHKDYLQAIPLKFVEEYKTFTSYLIRKYDIMYMDYSKLELNRNQYRDFDHLNKHGAEVFTKKLKKDLYDL